MLSVPEPLHFHVFHDGFSPIHLLNNLIRCDCFWPCAWRRCAIAVQVIRATTASLWRYPSNQDLQGHGVGALAVLTEAPTLCTSIANFAGAGACVAAVTTYPSDNEVCVGASLIEGFIVSSMLPL